MLTIPNNNLAETLNTGDLQVLDMVVRRYRRHVERNPSHPSTPGELADLDRLLSKLERIAEVTGV